ncbi:ATP phosphoribosyltransferase regulatory subunit [Nitratiruptor sp. SB155-2]|uniref:ATP phosphoribosyltransferase regulatory subunit n=1 Tax=Nitratiruptor sp. (strain SB155-2) TaxID=387092 RepID=UPI000158732E|nr:ATP phosphoribosyltransferase regulatory subunit [Nitratiruptor sp. SB155-2]BAF70732.1 conserved hypothetical protein [Nitratiruptor sp. SB155-2]
MVQDHEIPKGARLYFGQTAKIKRDIEKIASEILYEEGFEEIATPLFSYHQHKFIADEKVLIRLSDDKNRELSLRADSTIDVVRLITNRLGRSTEHKKWFYIQPVYRYPTQEFHQIGAEVLESKDVAAILKILIKFFHRLQITPNLQISNIKIPEILAQNYGIGYEELKNGDINTILQTQHPWVEKLLYIQTVEEIDECFGEVPEEIEQELLKMKELALSIQYDKLLLAPLFYAQMRYYKDLFFRFFHNNSTLAMGGEYEAAGVEANGFSLYTDYLINVVKGE